MEIVSERGREKFTADGYLYVFDKMSRDESTKFWRFEQKGRCKARIHTRDEEVIKQVNEHSHDSSAAKIEKDKVVTKIRNRAEVTVENTVQVINECTAGLSQAAQGVLPNYEALRKIVRRKRNEVNAAPPAPANLEALIIPELYTVYEPQPGRQENFLLADSGPGQNRILIFGRQSGLDILQESRQWYADGTFTLAPALFSQIYIILAQKFGAVHPVLYALLPNKQRATYNQLFGMIKEIRPNLEPSAIACDYEVAAFQAMVDCFPGVHLHGCFFHLAKNMKKHIGQLQLTNMYNNNPDFSLHARMVIVLAFVPIPDLDGAIDALEEELPAELQPLLQWFEDNYVGRLNRRRNGRHLPLFPVEMWNLHQRTLNGGPTLWKLIDGLKKVQIGRDIFYEQLVAGNNPPKKLKKYRDADERILHLVRDYQNREILEFLRGIAHNYQMQQ